MTGASKRPKIPWWVRWWTEDPTTTRSGLRHQAWLFFLLAAACVGIAALYVFGRPKWLPGEIVLSVSAGLFPTVSTIAGVWILIASRWIDRHQAWDAISTEDARTAYEYSHSLSKGVVLFLLATGGAIGALVGWVWDTGIGIPAGIGLGALLGYVFGSFVAGLREGMRSQAGSLGDVKSQTAEPGAAADGSRDPRSS